jgi:hypothetical protein
MFQGHNGVYHQKDKLALASVGAKMCLPRGQVLLCSLFYCRYLLTSDIIIGKINLQSVMQENSKQQDNAEKARQTAIRLYPHEKWEPLENGIFIAKSRMPRSAEQINVLEKELRQARILVLRGSTVYLLPEIPQPGEKKIKYPDAVVNGHIMEFKTITGGIRQVEERYKEARAKTTYIFMKIDAPLTRHDFTRKLSGYISRKGYSGGVILTYFTQSGEIYQWSEKKLRKKKSGSCDPAAIRGNSDIPKRPR